MHRRSPIGELRVTRDRRCSSFLLHATKTNYGNIHACIKCSNRPFEGTGA